MTEVWMPVSGYEGLYEVSNLGNVKSLKGTHKILRTKKHSKGGYLSVTLFANGNRKFYLVHRLVAYAFCEKPNGCDIVNHIDNNHANNNAINLEWVTQKQNFDHAVSVGARTIRPTTTPRPVIRSDGETVVFYPSACAAKKDGFNTDGIFACCRGQLKTYKGYEWRFAVADMSQAPDRISCNIKRNGVL